MELGFTKKRIYVAGHRGMVGSAICRALISAGSENLITADSSELDLRAVAHVTFNRASASGFPGSVCDVVTQGGERPLYTCQFQWWFDGRSDEPTDLAAWRRALGIAERVLSGQDVDPTDGALFFHNSSVTPSLSSDRQPTIRIGDHIFYR